MQVHIDRGGERYGPYSLEEVNAYLANGTLLPTDQAWQDGMADWVLIDQIPGVTMAGGSAAPPPSPAGATCPECQAPVEASQVICMGCGTQLQGAPGTAKGSKKKLLIGIGAGVGVLVILAVIGMVIGEGESKQQNVDATKAEGKVVETYERNLAQLNFKMDFFENGVYGIEMNGKKFEVGTRKRVGTEIHLTSKIAAGGIGNSFAVYRVETNGDLQFIAQIIDGKRTDIPKVSQWTYKKIK